VNANDWLVVKAEIIVLSIVRLSLLGVSVEYELEVDYMSGVI